MYKKENVGSQLEANGWQRRKVLVKMVSKSKVFHLDLPFYVHQIDVRTPRLRSVSSVVEFQKWWVLKVRKNQSDFFKLMFLPKNKQKQVVVKSNSFVRFLKET